MAEERLEAVEKDLRGVHLEIDRLRYRIGKLEEKKAEEAE